MKAVALCVPAQYCAVVSLEFSLSLLDGKGFKFASNTAQGAARDGWLVEGICTTKRVPFNSHCADFSGQDFMIEMHTGKQEGRKAEMDLLTAESREGSAWPDSFRGGSIPGGALAAF